MFKLHDLVAITRNVFLTLCFSTNCFGSEDQPLLHEIEYQIYGTTTLQYVNGFQGNDDRVDFYDTRLGGFANIVTSSLRNYFITVEANFTKEDTPSDVLEGEDISELYAGTSKENYLFGFGRVDYATSVFDISGSRELGADPAFNDLSSSGKYVVFGRYGLDNIELLYSYDTKPSQKLFDVDNVFGALVLLNWNNIELNLGYQHASINELDDRNTRGMSFRYDSDSVDYRIAFSSGDVNKVWQIVATKFLNNRIAVTAGIDKEQINNEKGKWLWYANIRYLVHKQVKLFSEVGRSEKYDSSSLVLGIELGF